MLRAWHDLATCRPYLASMAGVSPCAVPWTAIRQWCGAHDLDAAATAVVTRAIRIVDSEFLERGGKWL